MWKCDALQTLRILTHCCDLVSVRGEVLLALGPHTVTCHPCWQAATPVLNHRKGLFVCLWAVCLAQSSELLSHVERYEVVRPQRLPGRQRRSPWEGQVRHLKRCKIKIQTVIINNDIIQPSYQMSACTFSSSLIFTNNTSVFDQSINCYLHSTFHVNKNTFQSDWKQKNVYIKNKMKYIIKNNWFRY